MVFHHHPLRLAFQVIRGILKVSDPSDVPPRRLERYWREIDLDCSGTVDFEEFVIWIPGNDEIFWVVVSCGFNYFLLFTSTRGRFPF